MRLFRCDRCKKEYTFNEHTIDDCKLGMRNPNETALIVALPVDLCDDCRKDFENWFRQPMVDKAFEEAHAKAHAHEKGEVTLLGLDDGRALCPVCGLILSQGTVTVHDDTYGEITRYEVCPSCGSLFSENINYIHARKTEKENNNDEQQLNAEET